METLVISVPETKSSIVRQILKELGVRIKSESTDHMKPSDYARLVNISKEDAQKMISDIEQSRGEWERDI